MPTWALLVEILIAAVIVILSGARLATLADRVADVYGLGAAWVGALLLASVTSLPEVVTGVTATWVGRADMAFAAIFGSCSFNIVLIVLLNAFRGGGSILYGKGRSHTLNSSFGIVLISMSLLGILLVGKFQDRPVIAQTCELTIVGLIAVVYCACMRMAYRTERQVSAEASATNARTPDRDHTDVWVRDRPRADPAVSDHAHNRPAAAGSPTSADPRDQPPAPGVDTSPAPASGLMPRVVLVSGILVASAWWLARTGDVLADHPIKWIGRPLGATFVGSLFLAIATSLPEVVTSVSSLRLGKLDMALGNIFGSNMFNIFVIPMLKVASWCSGDTLLMAGNDFSAPQSLIAGLLPILLTGVVVGGLSYESPHLPGLLKRFGADSVLIALIYAIGMYLLLATP